MLFSIELLFDDETAEGLRRCWRSLATVAESDYMLSHGVYPHVSLSVFEADDPSMAEEAFAGCAGKIVSFQLEARGVGSFSEEREVVFIGFSLSERLFSAHEVCAQSLSKLGIVPFPYYRKDAWKPHCTLAMNFPSSRQKEVQAAASACELHLPYRVSDLALVAFPPTRLLAQERIADR